MNPIMTRLAQSYNNLGIPIVRMMPTQIFLRTAKFTFLSQNFRMSLNIISCSPFFRCPIFIVKRFWMILAIGFLVLLYFILMF